MDGKKNMMYNGEEALIEFENMAENADQVQDGLLKEILQRNGSTEYLNKYLNGSTDVLAFKSLVPVITYPHIRPYIQRIANGENPSLISGHTLTQLIRSSGTSGGEPKLMPYIAEDLGRWTFLYRLTTPIINKYVPGLDKGKAMYLYFSKAAISTPSGLPVWNVSTSMFQSALKHNPRGRPNIFTSPIEAILCTDGDQSMYCQLLSGLLHRHQVLRLGALFAAAFLRAITFLECNWARLCDDIRTGRLNSRITDPGCRSAMLDIMKSPDQQLADEIEQICSGGSWKGILCELWPKAKYIEAVVTGTMAQYIPALEFYSGGKLPLVSSVYASSECFVGLNLKPFCDPADVVYTLVPNLGYFEFIPLGDNGLNLMDDHENVPVDVGNVSLGSYYELIVTTFAGLNRYRIGDIVQVVGFYKQTPQLRFICRRNVVLSIDQDKTSEEDLHKSVTLAKKLLEPYNAYLVDYTSYADTSTVPGHYVLYWEIQHHTGTDGATNPVKPQILEDCCMVLEEALDYEYRRCRTNDKSLGPLEICVVKPGTFEALMDHCIENGTSMDQYKTPRGIKSSDALELLNSSVEDSFFSPRNPKVNP